MARFVERWKHRLSDWWVGSSQRMVGGLPAIREPDERVAEILIRVSEWSDKIDGEYVSVGEIVHQLRRCSFGVGLLIFALPSCIPMPPGFTTFSGLGLGIVAWQMIIGRPSLWLPKILARQRISPRAVGKTARALLPAIRRFERLCRRRLDFVNRVGMRVIIGVALLLLAVILMLPLPFMNLPPGVAASLLAVGMAESDGVFVLTGLGLTALIMLFLVAMALIAILGGAETLSWLFAAV